MILATFIIQASGLGATTYGWGEKMCGSHDKPAVKCTNQALTASGLPLGTNLPIAALALPYNFKLRGTRWVNLSIDGGKTCAAILLADKKNFRYKDSKPWDFSPLALERLGVKNVHKFWSTKKVTLCDNNT